MTIFEMIQKNIDKIEFVSNKQKNHTIRIWSANERDGELSDIECDQKWCPNCT